METRMQNLIIQKNMGQTIEELLGVGTRISTWINEDFALVKFALNELHSIKIKVDRSWDFEFTLR